MIPCALAGLGRSPPQTPLLPDSSTKNPPATFLRVTRCPFKDSGLWIRVGQLLVPNHPISIAHCTALPTGKN